MLGALAIGLWSPMAMAMGSDTTNCYFSTDKPVSSHAVILEGSKTLESSVLINKTSSSPVIIEKTISAPVMIQATNGAPVVIEDRIVKQKHFFGLGIWPLFDFEIL